jgi:7,8-dihydroneopterin aldolase/epimerase/oxygenase
MSDTLVLDDVRFYGQHGAPKTGAAGTWFSVDAELTFDLAPAVLSDDLGATIDYERVARRIVEIGTRQRANLLERLAGMIVETLLREFPAQQITVRVRKLSAPQGHGTPGVQLTRRR